MLLTLVALFLAPVLFAEGSEEAASEVREISWYYKEGNAQVQDDWYGAQKILEDLNIRFVHINPGGADYDTRLQLLLAARDVPNVITSYDALSANLIKWGVVQPVNKYVVDEAAKYIPNLVKNSLNWDLAVQMMTTESGNIYGVPCTNNRAFNTSMWIRMDWLDNLGLEVPATQDELLEVFRAFTFDDPDGNGKNDTYGTGFHNHWATGYYAIPFAASRGALYPDGNDGLIFGQYRPEHKEYLRFLRDLVAEGLVDQELLLKNNTDVSNKLWAGKHGYGWGWYSSNDERHMHEVNPDAVWEPMAPYVGDAYDTGYLGAGGVIREPYLVSSANDEEDLEAVFSLFNWLSDDRTMDPNKPSYEGSYWIARGGEKGVWWDVTPEGLLDVGQFETEASRKIKANKEGIQVNGLMRFRSKNDRAYYISQPPRQMQQFVNIFSYPTINDIPSDDTNAYIRMGIVTLPDALNERFGEFDSLQLIEYEKMFYAVVLGVDDLDESWDVWIQQAVDAGGTELMAEISAEYKKAGIY